MRRGLIAANWKMNGCKLEINALLEGILSGFQNESIDSNNCDVMVCPPSLYLAQVEDKLSGEFIQLGAQNIYTEDKGAYTGEVSAEMLTDFGCGFVLVGHSERRELFAESDGLVSAKFAKAQVHGLTPVLCIGESLQQREDGETEAVILRQLEAVLDENGVESFEQAVVAYEPVWAIGTGLTASPEQAQSVHKMIRETVSQRNKDIAQGLRILYGGSVKGANASDLFAQDDIDGALVGGASLQAEEFVAICASMAKLG